MYVYRETAIKSPRQLRIRYLRFIPAYSRVKDWVNGTTRLKALRLVARTAADATNQQSPADNEGLCMSSPVLFLRRAWQTKMGKLICQMRWLIVCVSAGQYTCAMFCISSIMIWYIGGERQERGNSRYGSSMPF